MSKIIEILEILNEFFQIGPQGLSVYDEESINPHLEKIYQSMDEKTTQNFKNHIKKLETMFSEEPSINEFAENMSGTIESLGAPEILTFALNFIKSNIGNLECIFYLSDFFEKDLYEKIYPILKYLSKIYSEQFKDAAVWLLSIQGDLSSYAHETESIMLIHDEMKALEANILEIKLSDLISFPDKVALKINKLDEKNFKLYFKDWALKFSSLIESKFKPILIFLNYLWKLDKKENVRLQKLKGKMLGEICKDFTIMQNYPNIDRFRVYRNNAFHAKIEFEYDNKWENRRILLRKDLIVSMAEFIFDYSKIFRFLNTFLVMVTLLLLNNKIHGKSAFEMYFDQIDKIISDKSNTA